MSKIDTEGAFAPADDVFAALESIPGIDDDFAEREAARDRMEREYRAAPRRRGG